jgi:probable F420-dependent oxidoreductase
MRLGFGLISCQRYPGDSRSWTDLYREALDLATVADRVGLDSVWTTEHHFVDDGYMSSLLVMSAAIAARTERITIGTGVVLAPLHDPIRLAEDAATVALLSGGRLVLGLGLGWSDVEFSAIGVDRKVRGRSMDEVLELLPAAWSGQIIDHDGAIYEVPPVTVRPVPDRPIPVWIGGNAEPAVRRAARLADGFFSNAGPDRLAEQIAIAADERQRSGQDRAFEWGHYQMIYVADDAEAGWREVRDYIYYTAWKYGDMEASATRGTEPLPEPPPITADTEERLRARTLVGPAEAIAEQSHEAAPSAGVPTHVIARSYFPGMPYTQQEELVIRLAEQVAPLLH